MIQKIIISLPRSKSMKLNVVHYLKFQPITDKRRLCWAHFAFFFEWKNNQNVNEIYPAFTGSTVSSHFSRFCLFISKNSKINALCRVLVTNKNGRSQAVRYNRVWLYQESVKMRIICRTTIQDFLKANYLLTYLFFLH